MTPEMSELQKLLLEMERRIGERQDALRTELLSDLREIKADLKDQGIALTRVETRLDEGDKRMESMDERIQRLEERERQSSLFMAKLAALASACGLGGGALAKVFGL